MEFVLLHLMWRRRVSGLHRWKFAFHSESLFGNILNGIKRL